MHPKGSILIFVVILVVAVVASCYLVIEKTTSAYLVLNGNKKISNTSGKIPGPDELTYNYSGSLNDIKNYKLYGKVNTAFVNGSFTVYSKIYNLPDPQPGHNYQGWLGKKSEDGNIKYVNIGTAEKNSNEFVNIFQGGTDMSFYIYYLLTEELADQTPEVPTNKISEAILTKNEIQPTPRKINSN